MITLILLIPWVLTVSALLFIIVKSKKQTEATHTIEEDIVQDIENEIVKIAQYGDKAYWVYDNIFYEAELMSEPDFSTAKPVDTMSMSQKQLNELLAILDELENHGKG